MFIFSDAPTGALPYLAIGDFKLGQSGAMNSYLAAEHGEYDLLFLTLSL